MAVTWKIDPSHSEILFKVRHLMISTVTGYFKKFDAQVITDNDDFNTTTEIMFSADVASIDTKSEQRDEHLKSEEFFDAEKYLQIVFTSTRYETLGDDATLQGNLTIRGVTKPIELDVEFGGIVVDPYGQTKAGFTVSGRISRKEFGLTWNAVTEAGNVIAGDEIKIHAEVQLIRQP